MLKAESLWAVGAQYTQEKMNEDGIIQKDVPGLPKEEDRFETDQSIMLVDVDVNGSRGIWVSTGDWWKIKGNFDWLQRKNTMLENENAKLQKELRYLRGKRQQGA